MKFVQPESMLLIKLNERQKGGHSETDQRWRCIIIIIMRDKGVCNNRPMANLVEDVGERSSEK